MLTTYFVKKVLTLFLLRQQKYDFLCYQKQLNINFLKFFFHPVSDELLPCLSWQVGESDHKVLITCPKKEGLSRFAPGQAFSLVPIKDLYFVTVILAVLMP